MSNRERLAWSILVASFSLCVVAVIAIPVGGKLLTERARRPLVVEVQANQGTVGILYGESESSAIFAGDPPQELNPSGTILTNATDTALVLIRAPEEEELLARIQVYGNSNLVIDEASMPRFAASSDDQSLQITLNSGRFLLTMPEHSSRLLKTTVSVPQGEITSESDGQYSLTTSNAETQIAVLQGEALLQKDDATLVLTTDQRGLLPADGSLTGPLDTERNLLRNGNFEEGLANWVSVAPSVEIQGQPPPETSIVDSAGEPTMRFRRLGVGHADSAVRQIIDQDVTDYESLKLVLSMRVTEQSLGVCGQQGSECPLFVRVDYVDANGVPQTWQQGFYANGNVGQDTPDICVTCPPPRNEHQRVPYQQLVFYESDNLLERLGQQGILPRQIKSITLTGSGHTYDTEVVEVALMARE